MRKLELQARYRLARMGFPKEILERIDLAGFEIPSDATAEQKDAALYTQIGRQSLNLLAIQQINDLETYDLSIATAAGVRADGDWIRMLRKLLRLLKGGFVDLAIGLLSSWLYDLLADNQQEGAQPPAKPPSPPVPPPLQPPGAPVGAPISPPAQPQGVLPDWNFYADGVLAHCKKQLLVSIPNGRSVRLKIDNNGSWWGGWLDTPGTVKITLDKGDGAGEKDYGEQITGDGERVLFGPGIYYVHLTGEDAKGKALEDFCSFECNSLG
jgi:hypothetical protein